MNDSYSIALKKRFAFFVGANVIHDRNGEFLHIEHTRLSRRLCAEYKAKGTTALEAFMLEERKGDTP